MAAIILNVHVTQLLFILVTVITEEISSNDYSHFKRHLEINYTYHCITLSTPACQHMTAKNCGRHSLNFLRHTYFNYGLIQLYSLAWQLN